MSYGLKVWDVSGVEIFNSWTDYLPLVVARGVAYAGGNPYGNFDSPVYVYINISTTNRLLVAHATIALYGTVQLQYQTEASRFVVQHPALNGHAVTYTVLEY